MQKRKDSNIWQIKDANGRRISSGTADRSAAKALEEKYSKERWARKHMPELFKDADSKPRRTLDEACKRWLKEYSWKTSAVDSAHCFDYWIKHYGADFLLSDITRKNADEIIRERVTEEASKKNSTANFYLVCLKKVINCAAKEWHSGDEPWYVGATPSFRYYQSASAGSRVLSIDEWRLLSGYLAPDLQEMGAFALCTLLRRGNVLSFSPGHIQDRAAHFTAQEMKMDVPHSLPLNETAQQIVAKRLRERPAIGAAPIFTFRGEPLQHIDGTAYRAWQNAIKAAGIPPATFHDLRRTAATWLAQEGIEEGVIERLGAWKSGGTMRRVYVHREVESLRAAVGVLDTILTRPAAQHEQNQIVAIA